MWIVLESLFGASELLETTHQLAQRIAVFLETDVAQREKVYRQVKKAYGYRSRVAHGTSASIGEKESLERLAETEAVVRLTVTAILRDQTLLRRFTAARSIPLPAVSRPG
jgi:hypothetical protein